MTSSDTLSTTALYEVVPAELTEAASLESEGDQLAREVTEGLSGSPKRLPAKLFYDHRGSELFQQITELDEYYPTDLEIEILGERRDELAELVVGDEFRLVELGAGDGQKVQPLIQAFLDRGLSFEFAPVDICHEMVARLTSELAESFTDPRLTVHGIVGEYGDALRRLSQREQRRNVVLFLGSSLGNMDVAEAKSFLVELRDSLAEDDLVLIGFDLKKDPHVLQAAYDDSPGVTREFNLNLLDRLNRELGGSFDRSLFRHHAFYNPRLGRMESWLLSTEPQTVAFERIDREFFFEAWEGVHLECSHKYTPEMVEAMATEAGFRVERHWRDRRGWFLDSLWRAVG